VTAQPVVALKTALVSALQSLLPNLQVNYGVPGGTSNDDQIVVGDARVTVTYPTLTRTEHDIELDLLFSSWREGDSTQQQTATEAALGAYETFTAWLRANQGNPFGLGDGLLVVNRTLCTSYTLTETTSPDEAEGGRLANVTTTLRTSIRPS
jgi:hypothetical protein